MVGCRSIIEDNRMHLCLDANLKERIKEEFADVFVRGDSLINSRVQIINVSEFLRISVRFRDQKERT